MAACCIYGAFVVSIFFREYTSLSSFNPFPEAAPSESKLLDKELQHDARQVITCHVGGMSCSSCAASVKSKLMSLTGVRTAHVDFLSGLTHVLVDRHAVRESEVLSAVGALGYTTQIRRSGSVGASSTTSAWWKWDRAVSWILLFIVPILVLETVPVAVISSQTRQTSIILLAGFVQVGFGLPFYHKTVTTILNTGVRHLPMDVLIASSTSVLYLAGLYFYFCGKDVHYATTAATLIWVISLGRYMDELFKTSSASTIAAFANIVPSEALLSKSSTVVPVHDLKPGDLVVVKPGHRFPCDGRLVANPDCERPIYLEIDESLHTGESKLVKKEYGDICLAGTANTMDQVVTVEVIEGDQSRLNQILDAVIQAQLYKSSFQPFVDHVSEYLVPSVILCALLAFFIWLPRGLGEAISFLSTTLVVACPCAFGLSVPVIVVIACSLSATNGIVVRAGAQTFQKASKATTIVFDKTGTLTTGCTSIAKYKIHGKWEERPWWQVIGEAEQESRHWASAAISKYIKEHFALSTPKTGSNCSQLIRRQETTGRGVSATIEDINVLLGNEQHLRDANIEGLEILSTDLATLEPTESCVFVALNGRYAGFIAFNDPVREDAVQEIQALKSQGYEIYMMTGDRPEVAQEVAVTLGIGKYFAQFSPLQKSAEISRLRDQGKVVVMVGDGINDTAALAAADIGISLQSQHSVVLASSDVVLLTSSLHAVSTALTLSKETYGAIKANIIWASMYNAVSIPLAMGVGARWNVTISPTAGGVLMMGSSLGVMYNSIRLRDILARLLRQN